MKFTRPTGISQTPTPATGRRMKSLIIKKSMRPSKSLESGKSLKRPNVVATLKKELSN